MKFDEFGFRRICSTMKLVHKNLEKDSSGSLTLIPEEETEDMWHVYNLIHVSGVVASCKLQDLIHEVVVYLQMSFVEGPKNAFCHQVGDRVRASTIRKVTTESSTGSTTSNRVRTILTIDVEDIDFDTQACKLRLKGDLKRDIVKDKFLKKSWALVRG